MYRYLRIFLSWIMRYNIGILLLNEAKIIKILREKEMSPWPYAQSRKPEGTC